MSSTSAPNWSSRSPSTAFGKPRYPFGLALRFARILRYPFGLALRFARILRYRPGKSAAQADTIDLVRAIDEGAPPRAEGAGAGRVGAAQPAVLRPC